MKFSVLLSILFDLLSKQSLTAHYLAEKHSLSPRTVYRYVEILSTHLPLRVKRGRNGGIFLADSYKLPMGFMTEQEYDAALHALEIAYAQSCDERFLIARRKLSAQKKTETKNLALLLDTGNVILDSEAFGELRSFAEILRIVEECVKKKYLLDIVYLEENGKKTQLSIEPHALVFERGAWSTYAFSHNECAFLLFRLGKILSATKTEKIFRKRSFPRDDIPFSSRQTQNILYARLEIKPHALSTARDWLGAACIRYKNGVWVADAALPDEDFLPKKILSFGDGIKVLEPLSLQEKISKAAQEVASLYL